MMTTETACQAIVKVGQEAAFSGIAEKFLELAAYLLPLYQQRGDDLAGWAIHGALAALGSALLSKDEIEARNIAALISLAFSNLERS
jgi:hypothetical protein